MKKLVLMGVVTLATANVFAVQGTSSSNISNAVTQRIDAVLATKPSQTNLVGTSQGVVDTTKISATGTKEDAVAVYNKGIKKAATFLVQNVSKPVGDAVTGAVNTLEFSANGTVVGITDMGGAVGQDGKAVSQTNPSQTNLAGTAAGTVNAKTLAATGADTVASGAFSSAPSAQVKEFKRKQKEAREKKQLAHAMAAQTAKIVIQLGATSPAGLAHLAAMGDVVSAYSGVALPNDEARVLAGTIEVAAALQAQGI